MAITLLLAVLSLHWLPQASGSTAGLRGLSVVSARVVWAGGSKGTILRTVDGGQQWRLMVVPGAEALDFRDVAAFDTRTAVVMASGKGLASRVYRTEDGGQSWTQVLSDPDEAGFFDAMEFWDGRHGLLLGDPVAGQFVIYRTEDGGRSWVRGNGPAALPNEGAFAASGTCVAVQGKQDVWFGTGGPSGGRVFHSTNRGESWTVAASPLAGKNASSGIFSLRFRDLRHGVAVGGDYQKPSENSDTLAITADGGATWTIPAGALGGYRSGLTYVRSRKLFLAVGTNGSDYSRDGGGMWTHLSGDNLNAVADGWAVGPKGLILRLAFDK